MANTDRTIEARWEESTQRWEIKIQRDRERKTFTSSIPGRKGKIEAEKKADRWLASRERLSNARFGALWEEYLAELLTLGKKASYIQHESLGRLWLLPDLAKKKVLSITEQDWQNCINKTQRKEKPISAKTCKNLRGAITSFCKYARKRGLGIHRPEFIEIPKNAPVGERRILQPAALKVLFEDDSITHYGKPVRCHYIHAWRFLVLTGLRRGELCGLKNNDIDGDVVYVRRSINEQNDITEGKTRAAQRYFVLTSRAQSVLEQQRLMLKELGIISDYVFPGEDAKHADPSSVYKTWATYRRQHGIDCNLHELRHTLISIAKADVPEQILKRAVGHTQKTDTFGIYGHTVDGDMTRMANILDGVFDSLLGDKK